MNFQIEGPEILNNAGNSKLKFQKYQKVRENKVAKYQKVQQNKITKCQKSAGNSNFPNALASITF